MIKTNSMRDQNLNQHDDRPGTHSDNHHGDHFDEHLDEYPEAHRESHDTHSNKSSSDRSDDDRFPNQQDNKQPEDEHSTDSDTRSHQNDDVNRIVDELVSLISLPKITKEYIEKMKNIVHTSDNKKEVHKYTKWILCMTYLVPIIKMYLMNDNKVKNFIERHKQIANNGVVAVQNGSLTYYDICVPKTLVDLSDVKNYVDENVLNFVINLIENKNSKEHRILSKMTEHIFLVVCRSDRSFNTNDSRSKDDDKISEDDEDRHISFCWQFKDINEKRKIEKMVMKKKSQLIAQIDKTNLHIRYDPNEIVSQLLSVKDILDTESDEDESIGKITTKTVHPVHRMPLRKPNIEEDMRSSQIDDLESDEKPSADTDKITITKIITTVSENESQSDKIQSEYCESLDKQIRRFKNDKTPVNHEVNKTIVRGKDKEQNVDTAETTDDMTEDLHNILFHQSGERTQDTKHVHSDHEISQQHRKNIHKYDDTEREQYTEEDYEPSEHPIRPSINKISSDAETTSSHDSSKTSLRSTEQNLPTDKQSRDEVKKVHDIVKIKNKDKISNVRHEHEKGQKHSDSQEGSVLESVEDSGFYDSNHNDNCSSIVTEDNCTVTETIIDTFTDNTMSADLPKTQNHCKKNTETCSKYDSTHDSSFECNTSGTNTVTDKISTSLSDNAFAVSTDDHHCAKPCKDISQDVSCEKNHSDSTLCTSSDKSVSRSGQVNSVKSGFTKNAHVFNVKYDHSNTDDGSDTPIHHIQKIKKNKMNIIFDISLTGLVLYVYMICAIIRFFITLDFINIYHRVIGLPEFVLIRLPKSYVHKMRLIIQRQVHRRRDVDSYGDIDEIDNNRVLGDDTHRHRKK